MIARKGCSGPASVSRQKMTSRQNQIGLNSSAATLGVPTLTYLPYAFVNLLNPLTAIVYGITRFTITPLEADQEPAPAEA